MNKLGFATIVMDLASSIGVGAVVGNAVKATTPDNLKTYQKVSVGIGSVVISRAVSELTSAWSQEQLVKTVEQFQKLRGTVQTPSAEDVKEKVSEVKETAKTKAQKAAEKAAAVKDVIQD